MSGSHWPSSRTARGSKQNAGPTGVGQRFAASYDQTMLDNARHEAALRQEGRNRLERLTPRELEVLQMIVFGMTNAEAARRLELSVHAIKFHLAAVYRRLGVANRTEAAVAYLRWVNDSLEPRSQGD